MSPAIGDVITLEEMTLLKASQTDIQAYLRAKIQRLDTQLAAYRLRQQEVSQTIPEPSDPGKDPLEIRVLVVGKTGVGIRYGGA